MNKKIIIHNVEDNADQSDWVKWALCNDPAKSFFEREDLKDRFVNTNFTFKRFCSVGEAIEYYNKTNLFPDIIIVDIDFTELSSEPAYMNKPEECTNTRGWDLIKYLAEKRLKQIKSKELIVRIFSAQLGKATITERLPEFANVLTVEDLYGKPDKADLFDKAKPYHLIKKLSELLKIVAIKYFKTITNQERTHIKNLLKECGESEILKQNINVQDFSFKLEYLLMGWCELQYNKKNKHVDKLYPEINSVISKLLKDFKKQYIFIGDWDERNENNIGKEPIHGERKMLDIYLEYPIPDLTNKINIHALNFILEVLYLLDNDRKFGLQDVNSNGEVFISEPIQIKPTYSIAYKKVENDSLAKFYEAIISNRRINKKNVGKIFYDKLIARRVLLSLERFIDDYIDYEIVCDILYDGAINYKTTVKARNEKEKRTSDNEDKLKIYNKTRMTSLINTKLGLIKRKGDKFGFEDGEDYCLPDEIEWFRIYVPLIKDIKVFLIEIRDDFARSNKVTVPPFRNLVDLKIFVNRYIQINYDIYMNLKNTLFDNLEDRDNLYNNRNIIELSKDSI